MKNSLNPEILEFSIICKPKRLAIFEEMTKPKPIGIYKSAMKPDNLPKSLLMS